MSASVDRLLDEYKTKLVSINPDYEQHFHALLDLIKGQNQNNTSWSIDLIHETMHTAYSCALRGFQPSVVIELTKTSISTGVDESRLYQFLR